MRIQIEFWFAAKAADVVGLYMASPENATPTAACE